MIYLFVIAALLERHLAHTHGIKLAFLITHKNVFISRPADSAAADGNLQDGALDTVSFRSQLQCRTGHINTQS